MIQAILEGLCIRVLDGEKHRPRKRLMFLFCVLVTAVQIFFLHLDAKGHLATPITWTVIYTVTLAGYIGHNIYGKQKGHRDDDLPGDLVVTFVVLNCIWIGISYGLSSVEGTLPALLQTVRIPEALEWTYGPTLALYVGSSVVYRILPIGKNNQHTSSDPSQPEETEKRERY